MKTTVEIAPVLLEEAKRQARERGTTLRALIEDGLRKVLAETPDEEWEYKPVTVSLKNPPGIDLSDPRAIKALGRYSR